MSVWVQTKTDTFPLSSAWLFHSRSGWPPPLSLRRAGTPAGFEKQGSTLYGPACFRLVLALYQQKLSGSRGRIAEV